MNTDKLATETERRRTIRMASPLALTAEAPPLAEREGILYVGGTRVTLSSVLHAYHDGAAAEDIQRKFPTLALADIYAVLAYYLRHREECDAYLEQRRIEAEELQRRIEERWPQDDLRERIRARRAQNAEEEPAAS
jgi:uncharacterized protein (DUF433 family)